jgi:hypothetical protein
MDSSAWAASVSCRLHLEFPALPRDLRFVSISSKSIQGCLKSSSVHAECNCQKVTLSYLVYWSISIAFGVTFISSATRGYERQSKCCYKRASLQNIY